MLALVLKLRKNVTSLLLCASAITLASCATQKDPPRLVSDPDEHQESAIPWNRQEKWEMAPDASGALGPLGSSDSRH
jgi:hypothetical protein